MRYGHASTYWRAPHSVEGIRADELRRLFNKLSLSPEQMESIENLSRSLVAKLVHGPIAETLALLQEPRVLVTIGETLHDRRRA